MALPSLALLFTLLLALCALAVADRDTISTMTGAHKAGERLVGGNRCTWGPSYWCQGVKKAKQCGAVSHCVQSVWAKEQSGNGVQDGSAVCGWCDDLMDDIRELVAANTSKVAMRGYLKDGCRRIPDAGRRAGCLEDISEDLAEVRQMLASGVPDRTICRTINFCSLPTDQPTVPMTALIPAQITPRNYCADCHHFFEDAKEIYIGNYTEDEFKQMLLDQCDQAGYPALTELCKTVIEQYWPQIYSRLKMFFDPDEVCIQLNFCDETAKIQRHWALPLIPVAQARARARTASKTTPANNLLSGLPLNRMLLNLNLQPSAIGSRSPASQLTPKKPASYKSDVECVVCEFVMAYLDKLLADNYTEAAIQSALGRVCSIMPKSVRDDCQSFVDQYAPAIFVILSNELDPAMVCQGLQLCNSDKAKVKSCGGNGATCEGCTDVFQAIKTVMEDYDENVRISNMIKSYCAFFPSDARDQCETAVTTYVPYALQMLAQLLQPQAVCKAVKLC